MPFSDPNLLPEALQFALKPLLTLLPTIGATGLALFRYLRPKRLPSDAALTIVIFVPCAGNPGKAGPGSTRSAPGAAQKRLRLTVTIPFAERPA